MHGNPLPEIIFSTHPGQFIFKSNIYRLYYPDICAYAWLPTNKAKFMVNLIRSFGSSMVVKFEKTNAENPKPGDKVKIQVANNFLYVPGLYLPTTFIKRRTLEERNRFFKSKT